MGRSGIHVCHREREMGVIESYHLSAQFMIPSLPKQCQKQLRTLIRM